MKRFFLTLLTMIAWIVVVMLMSALIGAGWMLTFGVSAWFLFLDFGFAMLAIFVYHRMYECMQELF